MWFFALLALFCLWDWGTIGLTWEHVEIAAILAGIIYVVINVNTETDRER